MRPSRSRRVSRVERTLTPDDLVTSPELAALTTLDAVLHVAVLALVAENADLLLDQPTDRAMATTPRLRAAEAVIARTHALRRALDHYRDLLDAAASDPLHQDDDVPI